MKLFSFLMVVMALSVCAYSKEAPAGAKPGGSASSPVTAADSSACKPLPGEGEKVELPGGGWFTYKLGKKELGTVVLKVQVFGKDGKRTTAHDIFGSYDMPEMKGMHASGDRKFSLSKKQDYLLPVDFAMPGEWEISVSFRKAGKAVYCGYFRVTL